jgi:hypothetical protein
VIFNNMLLGFNGQIQGSGQDENGSFNITGQMNNTQCTFVKQYHGAHSVNYQGQVNGNRIAGQWSIPGNCQGGFEIYFEAQKWSGFYM